MVIQIDKQMLFKEALENGINLFTGAGFSKLPDPNGKLLPDAPDLSSEICERFNVSSSYSSDLERISNIVNIRSKQQFQKYLREKYTVSTYNPLYNVLNKLTIKSYITTNIDNIIQCVIDDSDKYYLNNISIYGATKRSHISIPYIPLHGEVKNLNSNLYFGKNELANVDNDNKDLFDVMHSKLLEAPTLFWGYGFHDNAIERTIVKILEEPKHNIWIQCMPGSKNIQYFRDLGCYIIEASTEDLFLWIKNEFEQTLPTAKFDYKLSGLERYVVPLINKLETVSLQDYFLTAKTHWYCILSKYPYETKNVNDIYEVSLSSKNVFVLAIPFAGKTTMMMQLSAKMHADIKLILSDLNLELAKLVVNKLDGQEAVIFVDDCCEDIEGIKYLMMQPSLRVIGFTDDFVFESSKHIIEGLKYEKIYVSELEIEEAQHIYQYIPSAIKSDEFKYKEKQSEKFSMLEMMSLNIKGILSRERVLTLLRKIENTSDEVFEVVAIASYLATNNSVLSTDILFSYFGITNYEKVKGIIKSAGGFLSELDVSILPDMIDQDYFAIRSKLFSHFAIQILRTNFREKFGNIIEKFTYNVTPFKIYKYYVFKRSAYDAYTFYKLFGNEAHDLYKHIYKLESSPYTLQQWALYKAYNGAYKEAFSDIDRAINEYPNNFSIKNTRAIILFEANKDTKSEIALNGMAEAMETLNQCYSSDKRKAYHARKYAEFAIFLDEEWGEDKYLGQAKEWLEDIIAKGESKSYPIKSLLNKLRERKLRWDHK